MLFYVVKLCKTIRRQVFDFSFSPKLPLFFFVIKLQIKRRVFQFSFSVLYRSVILSLSAFTDDLSSRTACYMWLN